MFSNIILRTYILFCVPIVKYNVFGTHILPHVETKLGKVEGEWALSESGKPYAVFNGIPFAQPPIGDLRFKDPQPPNPWQGTLKANKLYLCAQRTIMGPIKFMGTEDCLYLNIYVPKHLLSGSTTPVILYIHSGAFMIGGAHDSGLPTYLMDHDVIFVTLNYRLNIFGFVSTQDSTIPGNFGLKDQVMALKWIKEHISNFGGDPGSVTLAGTSAGGGSVNYHYLSPLSKGLFHRGISISGTAFSSWGYSCKPLEKIYKIADLLQCPSTSSEDILQCLQNKNTEEILSTFVHLDGPYGFPVTFFGPTKEPNGPNAFITNNPLDIAKEGNVYDVPWVLSNMAMEGIFILKFFIDDMDNIGKNWNSYAPYLFGYNDTVPSSKWDEVSTKVKEKYFGNKEVDSKSLKEMSDILSDRYFFTGIYVSTHFQSKVMKSPIKHFTINYLGSQSYSRLIPSKNQLVGPTHIDDNYYYFKNEPPFTKEDDFKMRDLLVTFLVNYAKTGEAKMGNVEWKNVTPDTLNSLVINSPNDLQMDTLSNFGNSDFWFSFSDDNSLI